MALIDLGYRRAAFAAIVCSWLAGCSGGPPRELPPTIDPSAAGQAAVAEYDADHDGAISGPELEKCPALAAALSRYETNGNRKVTAETIAARIEKWQSTKTGIANLSLTLTLDGQPLRDATVTAEPEKFLGSAIQPATAVTDAYGNALLRVPGKLGAQYGLYKLRISKMSGGKETIPSRYNARTELGLEFAPDAPELLSTGFAFSLKSK